MKEKIKFIKFDRNTIIVRDNKDEDIGTLARKPFKQREWVFEPDLAVFLSSQSLGLIKKKLEELEKMV